MATKVALLSVSLKNGLVELAEGLVKNNFKLIASGGTSRVLSKGGINVTDVADITGTPELLDGRVKTLHPTIHAGILCRSLRKDLMEMQQYNYPVIDMVICNLYPFWEVSSKGSCEEAVENIDIGGMTMLRAGAKNHERVTTICRPEDYGDVLKEMSENGGRTSSSTRKKLAVKTFLYTSEYERQIASYFQKIYSLGWVPLRQGMNSHQKEACFTAINTSSPLTVKNGEPTYINLLDGLNSWQLVKELALTLGFPAAASFKHVSPAGAAVSTVLSEAEEKMYMVKRSEASDLSIAYAKARGADPLASFGDFVALSHPCDVSTAKLLAAEVSDGVISPGYDPEALNILKKKKNGRYCILQVDPSFTPSDIECRTVFGINLQQLRNTAHINKSTFSSIPSKRNAIIEKIMRDLIVATVAVKYTQSNSVCAAKDGQVIGAGAGQQARIYSTQLAVTKAHRWWLRQHPRVMELKFKKSISRTQRIHTIDGFLQDSGSFFSDGLIEEAEKLKPEEKQKWLKKLDEVVLTSDGFLPFRDNVDFLANSGVEYIASPGGSVRDQEIVEACDQYNILLARLPFRLFHH